MSESGKSRGLGNSEIWAAPVLLAFVTCVGLTAALLADGAGDWLSWLSLFVPVVTIIACIGNSYRCAARDASLPSSDTKTRTRSDDEQRRLKQS
jgi:hypothetical protein